MNDLIKELKGTVVAWESLRKISDLPQQALLAGVIGDIMSILSRHEGAKEEGVSRNNCPVCGGRGWYAIDNGSGGAIQEQCGNCFGNGFIDTLTNDKAVEPLAVGSIKKHIFSTFLYWDNDKWVCRISDSKGNIVKTINGPTWKTAQDKAMEYLEGLPDKGEM